MNNSFAAAARTESQKKLTENMALAYTRPSDSALLTLFGVAGSMRPRDEKDIESMFAAAFAENPLLATKLMFYVGDIRGGLGERRTFRVMLNWLAKNHPEVVNMNMNNIPHYNRFDSWYSLVNTPVEKQMWEIMGQQLYSDMINAAEGKSISLLAKWLKSENASSKETKILAKKTIKNLRPYFELDARSYRKILSILRNYLKVTESKMSANEWNKIFYSNVPSYAMKRYAKAFERQDGDRFRKYIADLVAGKEKVNASVLFPYDLVAPYLEHQNVNDILADQQWKALSNYVEGQENLNILCMADVSGSMYGRPIASSIGLALYFAERTKGAFKNLYMTFTDEPHFISVDPNDTLRNKVDFVRKTGVGYNTNLELAFEEILHVAVSNRVPQEEMPVALIVLSDSEIDRFRSSFDGEKNYYRGWEWDQKDFVATMRDKFNNAGYNLPKLVFFQLESRQNTFLSQDPNVLWVSGQSPSVFRVLLQNLMGTPIDLLENTLNDERYDRIKVPYKYLD